MARLSQTVTGATLDHVTDDAFLLAHTPGPTLPVAPAVRDLRAALAAATADLLAIPDSALETAAPLSIADSRGRTVAGVLAGLAAELGVDARRPAWPQGSDSGQV